jgi:ribonucleoside-diphosphate reductase alpha chain
VDDLRNDSLGTGEEQAHLSEEELAEAQLPLDNVINLASTGYVRSNNFEVLQGGLSAMASNAAAQSQVTEKVSVATVQATVSEVTATSTSSSGGGSKIDKVLEARMKGYEGDSCGECGNFTLVRNGTCMKCDTCGATSGCS